MRCCCRGIIKLNTYEEMLEAVGTVTAAIEV